jgi:glycosyltransferase involved in cell wall biosynthesis
VAAGVLVNGKGPLVSIVIPTYNYAQFVGRALNSLLSQTFSDIELIVIDDASTDDTPKVLEAYRGDTRVRLVRHDSNQGHIRTYNEGLVMARGEYVGLLSADDVCLRPDAVARQVAVFESDPRVGMVYSAQAWVDESDRLLQVNRRFPADRVREGLDEFKDLIFTNYVPASGTLVRRACHELLGYYDERFPDAGDWELWLRISTRFRLGYIAAPLYGWRLHGTNMHHHTVSPAQACSEHVLALRIAFGGLPSSATPEIRRLRRPALRQLTLTAVDWDKGHGHRARAWHMVLHGLRYSPDLLVSPRFYWVLAKLTGVTLLGHRLAMRLSGAAAPRAEPIEAEGRSA